MLLGLYAWPRKNTNVQLASASPVTVSTAPPATQSPSQPPAPVSVPAAKPKSFHSKVAAVPPQPSMSQECAPGSDCAMSNNQQGGITAAKVVVNPPVNPNQRVLTYDCNGTWKSQGPGEHSAMEVDTCWPKCEKPKVFDDMMALNNARNYPELMARCEKEIKTTPEWLTPYLFCGLADAASGDLAQLKARLAYYDEHAGPAYNTGQCKDMSEFLHNELIPKQP